MKIALVQTNPVVGDIEGNTAKVIARAALARAQGADLAVFPELTVTGYPPKDLLLKPHFIRRNVQAIERIAEQCDGLITVVGYARPNSTGQGKELFNAAAVCANGRVVATKGKTLLPTYDIFDETRYFSPDLSSDVTRLIVRDRPWRLGFSICEDLWNNEQFANTQLYKEDPIANLARAGVDLMINISASPFWVGKHATRVEIFGRQVAEHGVPLVYVNQVGGNDELLFDGQSAVFAADGRLAAQAKAFEEDLLLVDMAELGRARREPPLSDVESVFRALVMGTRDYVTKCGFKEVVLGLSGGIDSAVTACIATAALGTDKVHGVALPSRHSSDHSITDARSLAANLGIDFRIISIEGCHAASEAALAPHFGNATPGMTEENLQARARGNFLMALSNKFNWLLLTTGNKSELAVGYCTLYGDMCGGLAVLSDVPKMMVYALANFINQSAGRDVIPINSITKPPSAELRENQTDQDSLPPYEMLDAILRLYVEREESIEAIVAAGFDRDVVVDVIQKVDRNEYKRKQAATGLKVTSRAFGTGRRMPIAARYT
jgi:NAD+ synthase (glutamine-hydrolysing)